MQRNPANQQKQTNILKKPQTNQGIIVYQSKMEVESLIIL